MALRTHKRSLALRRRQEGHRRYVREQRHKTLKVATITAIILLCLVLAGGFAYAWYSGKDPIRLAAIPMQVSEPQQVAKVTPKINNTARVGVSVQLISSPVAPGDNATISIHTNPLVSCSILVKYGEAVVKDSGLITKKADEFGTVTWSWTVTETATEGKWPVRVTCYNKKNSGVAVGMLEVSTKATASEAKTIQP